MLRAKYFEAEVGITGANMLIAETGHSVIVTNEGNGDLSQSLPRVHIVMASLEKIVPTLEDASVILRLLGRSATGQEMSVYTTFSKGPRRAGDPDGPEEYHVVLLDNGRSNMVGTEMQEMLRCIRCGACMNHCPVYQAVGGHAYGWVYPGPIGAVLTPALIGVEAAAQLPNASTFCGRCEEVCPVRIPLPKLMRHWREREWEKRLTPGAMRLGARGLGVAGGAAVALPAGDAGRRRRRCGCWRGGGGGSARCRSPAAGPGRGTFRRRRGGRSWTSGRPGGGERARAHPRAAASAPPGGRRRSAGRASRRGSPGTRRGRCRRRRGATGAARVVQFMAKAEAAAATISRVSGIGELPRAVAHELRKRNLPAAVRFGSEPMFEGLDWGMLATEPRAGADRGAGDAEPGGLRARRDRDAGAGLGAGEPGDADVPRRDAFRGAARGGHLRRLRGLLGGLARRRGGTRGRSTW